LLGTDLEVAGPSLGVEDTRVSKPVTITRPV